MTAPHSVDVEIARLAARQHGVVTSARLHSFGLSDSAIAKRVKSGRLHRVHRGVFAVGHGALSRTGHWMAAVLAAGEGAALSHVAAATHWNIWKRRGAVATEVVAPRRVRGVRGIHVHSCRNLGRRDVQRRFGVPVTSVARTILDLGDRLTPWQLANVIHEAEFRNLFRLRELEDVLARNRGRRAVTIVRQALALRAGGSIGTMSDLEDEFLAKAQARGLDPAVGVEVVVLDGTIRTDIVWHEIKLVVEIDHGHHDRIRTRREDLGRDARFRAAGYTVLRCRRSEFDACLDRVEELLGIPALLV